MCIREYIFCLKQTGTHKQKAKETIEEKRKQKETKKQEKENLAAVNRICEKSNRT